MIKRALTILSALIALVWGSVSHAQEIGSWKQYALYSGVPEQVTVNKEGTVYYLSMGRLYSYDQASGESRDYIGDIGARKISFVKYNPDKGYLVGGCEGGDVVLVYDDGQVYVMNDISDASIHYEKNLSDVCFDGDELYVTTTFGIVVFDTKNHTVKWSGIYGKKLRGVTTLGDKLIVSDDKGLYIGEKGKRIADWSDFVSGPAYIADEFAVVNAADNVVAYRTKGKGIGSFIFNPEDNTATTKQSQTFQGAPYLINARDGWYFKDSSTIYQVVGNGAVATKVKVTGNLVTGYVGFWTGLNNVWAGTEEGVGLYDLSGTTVTVKAEPLRPTDAIGVAKPGIIKGTRNNNHIYVSAYGPTWKAYNDGNVQGRNTKQAVYLIDGENLTDKSVKNQTIPAGFAEDPDDPSIYYMMVGSAMIVVKDNTIVKKFTSNDMPLPAPYGYGLEIDPENNIWVYGSDFTDARRPIVMLPSAKRKDINNVKKSDWIVLPSMGNITGQVDSHVRVCDLSGIIVFYTGEIENPIIFYDTKKTYGNISDDSNYVSKEYIDQDGRSVNLGWTNKVVEDKTGKLWIATAIGIFVVENPAKMVSGENRTVRSVKVPRNDGTDFADYLLDGETVYDISVDGNNRKWFATLSSGVYCVSADGTEILHHFTKENSPLPDNMILSIYADPNSSNVYISTLYGVLRYTQDAAPASDSYEDVYAYPNPVKPGYTGWITVTNLMNNSLVKIMDSAGQLIYEGRSNGGNFVWDGCNSNGQRVKSGVYYVFASQNANDSASGAVTKILIMN